jgi:hypothetical protein
LAGSSIGSGGTPSASVGSPTPGADYNPRIDPASFTTKITNPYLPYPVGTTYIFDGTRDGVPTHTEVVITHETKTILGVKCIVVRDIVTSNTALVEKTVDWYAQDAKSNVWYFGEDTAEYKNGAVTSTQGTWLAGVNGAIPGIVMPAHPTPGPAYRQEYRPGVAEDMAQVQRTNATVNVPAGSYKNVVVTKDTDPLNLTKLEHKYYAPNVGTVFVVGTVNGHHEETRLTSILTTK